MNLLREPYLEQLKRWPTSGRHILTQFDAETVIVYQAYCPEIGVFAAKNQRFGGEFSFSRMSWIKPNFLWMMYRSGWGTKEGQEVILAVRLKRAGFEEILRHAVHSSYVPEIYRSPENWRTRLAESDVRLQWDPDHAPCGAKQERRAIQLGLSGEVLKHYAQDWIVSIENISQFVSAQRVHAQPNRLPNLITPREDVYAVSEPEIANNIGVSEYGQKL